MPEPKGPGSKTGKSPRDLFEQAKKEFSRPVPQAYRPLIAIDKGDGIKIGKELFTRRIFKNISGGTGFSYMDLFHYVLPDNAPEHDPKQEIRKLVASLIKGRDFIDLGSGYDERGDTIGFETAKKFGARRYIGVDLQVQETFRNESIPQVFFKSEVLEFISKVSDPRKDTPSKFIAISGLDPDFPSAPQADQYFKAFSDELRRITKKGDVVYIGPFSEVLEDILELKKIGFVRGREHLWTQNS
ncbi:MAG TPA: hypothetical protein VJB95_01825 [Candidatus Paceibacterota bacterium]